MSFIEEENKVVFVDWGLFLHRALFGWEIQRKAGTGVGVPAHYTCLNMVISCLKLVGIGPDDYIVIAIDGRGNWRRKIDPSYKANRRDIKDKDEIDWKYWYSQYDNMVEKLKKSTPWNYIRIPELEADDIISCGVRKFSDKICVIISSDSDFEQLTAFKNVRLFSPVTKKYKYIENPYQILAKKIKKETTDNLLSPILDENDFNRRMKLVNLLELPEDVEKRAFDELAKVRYNSYNVDLFPFKKLKEKFLNIYNSETIVQYEKCIKKNIKKKKVKKIKEKSKNVQSNKEIL